jgi:hypothetical protein
MGIDSSGRNEPAALADCFQRPAGANFQFTVRLPGRLSQDDENRAEPDGSLAQNSRLMRQAATGLNRLSARRLPAPI